VARGHHPDRRHPHRRSSPPSRCSWRSAIRINSLSLLALVLAVGIVVDDAIVVVENVERYIREGLSPKEAAYKSMQEVSVALIAIGLVLVSVFIPTMFVAGHPGHLLSSVRRNHRGRLGGVAVRLPDAVAGHGRPAAAAARRSTTSMPRVRRPSSARLATTAAGRVGSSTKGSTGCRTSYGRLTARLGAHGR